jgi:hypothetical protein
MGGHNDHTGANRVEPHEVAARAKRVVAAAESVGLQSFWVEIGNEPDIGHDGYAQHPEDFAEAIRQSHEALRNAGFGGPVVSGGVANLDNRGIGYVRRMLASGAVPPDVVIGFHRYPETGHGPEAPHKGSKSRDDEWRHLLEVTGTRALACTEFGYHTAPEKKLGFIPTQRSDKDAADGVAWDLTYFRARNVTAAVLFQLNDGPNPNYFEHCFGIRRTDGTLKPVATAVQAFAATA